MTNNWAKTVLWILGILVVAMLVLTSVRGNNTKTDQVASNTETSTATDLSTDNQTDAATSDLIPADQSSFTIPADWQTYTNDQSGFSISYPPGWQLSTGTGQGIATITNYDTAQNSGDDLSEGQIKRVLQVAAGRANATVKDVIKDEITDQGVVTTQDGRTAYLVETNVKDGGTAMRAIVPIGNDLMIITNIGSRTNLVEMVRSVKDSG